MRTVEVDRETGVNVKSMKMFALIAIAALAAVAAVATAAAVASVEDPAVGLCKVKPNEKGLCPEASRFVVPVGGSLGTLVEATNPVLEGTLTEKCATSKSEFKTSEQDKKVLKGQVTKLTFTGSCTPCTTVTAVGLPYAATLEGNGTDYVQTSSGGASLTGCTFGLSCKFEGKNVTLLGANTAEGAEFKAEKEELEQTGGSAFFCGSTGKWSANYKVTAVDLYNSKGELTTEHKGPAYLDLLPES
jgi:hypothetical protein